jgi:hypothetical protein
MKTAKKWPKCTARADHKLLALRPRWVSTRASSFYEGSGNRWSFSFCLNEVFKIKNFKKLTPTYMKKRVREAFSAVSRRRNFVFALRSEREAREKKLYAAAERVELSVCSIEEPRPSAFCFGPWVLYFLWAIYRV